jgi:MFS family permease
VAVNLGPVLYYTAGVFANAITNDVGWTRGAIAAASLPGNLLITLTLPLAGWAVDKFGARRVALTSSALFAVALALLGQFSRTPTSFAALMLAANAAGFGLTPLPYAQIVSGWFDHRRGLALSLMLVLGGIGTAAFPPLSSALIREFGWRNAYSILGIIVSVVGVLSALLLLRDPPQPAGKNSGRVDIPGVPIFTALKGRPFWTLFVSFLCFSIAIGGGTTSLPLILTDSGASAQQASFIMSVVGIMMIVARIVLGQLLDRIFAPRLTAVVFLGPAIAFSILAVSPTNVSTIVAAALLGFGLGAEVDTLSYIASRAFGLRYFGRIFGALMVAFSIGLGIGPTLFGKLYDQSHSYQTAVLSALGLSMVASALLATLRKEHLPFVSGVGAVKRPGFVETDQRITSV